MLVVATLPVSPMALVLGGMGRLGHLMAVMIVPVLHGSPASISCSTEVRGEIEKFSPVSQPYLRAAPVCELHL
jgi:hypothetical protein